MELVILAGGLGTRISEETYLKPKPMLEIGGKPILWHIMKLYSAYGVNEFIICCGYRGYVIKEYPSPTSLRRTEAWRFSMTCRAAILNGRRTIPRRQLATLLHTIVSSFLNNRPGLSTKGLCAKVSLTGPALC